MDPNSLMEEYGQNQNKSNYNTQQIEPKKMRTTKSQDSLRTKPIKTNQQSNKFNFILYFHLLCIKLKMNRN